MVPIIKLSLSDGSEANAAYFTQPDNTPTLLPQLTLSSFIETMPMWCTERLLPIHVQHRGCLE